MKQRIDNNSRRCHIAINAQIYVDQIVFQEGADQMSIFKVDHKFLPASNGLGRSDHMSVVPDPAS